MRKLRAMTTVAGAAVLVAMAALTTGPAAQADRPMAGDLVEYQVHDGARNAQVLADAGLDVVAVRQGGDLVVAGDDSTADQLRGLGLRADVSRRVHQGTWAAPSRPAGAGLQDETYYGGYHTVNAHYANMDAAASAHPDLASVVSYGQSWRKQQGQGGYDLKAVCITKMAQGDCAVNPNSKKPRFLLQAQVHAREIATGEMAYKYINYLVNGYGKDATVTNLLDTTEIWVVPIVNPDGVDLVQRGGNSPVMHRKNADFTQADLQRCGDSVSSQPGVDINRNFGYGWQSNTSKCDQTTSTSNGSSDSEPETKALEQFWGSLFGDHRADGPNDKVDAGARGTALMLHSYAGIIILPWEYTHSVHSPNDAQFRAMGKDMSQFSGYRYGQAGELLYDAAGGSDDYAYGKLGMASFTIELGDNGGSCDGFAPRYSCVDSKFYPYMQKTFNYLASKAPSPFK
ncbi:M14 family zinc carboxypeptidase [Amycolatopsis sp. H20-H5]|uniref:M14 family zinc carboxypeptidase n=1 Tax=Amycolatopsis sp. H20-H5 TaxID=3046309 RepID=UPI002DBBD656|nr:M14 family zinc carboxypeptidase [Amycolatopsis sp. H20-H5]MEC3981190.1 M14 family zinc carboxypeptidase [Amycolatopsis sp. H20-H5]